MRVATAKFQTSKKPTASQISRFHPARTSLLQRKCACGGTPGPSGECEECRKKRLQRKVAQPSTLNHQHSEVPPIVHEVVCSPGQPLNANTRAFMEPRFGHDFSRVQTHSDPREAGKAPAHLLTLSGGPAANLRTGHNEVFVNGPGGGAAPNPSSPASAPRPQPPPTSAATSCPTDIK